MSMTVNRAMAGSIPLGNSRVLAQSSAPVAIVSDGTVAADGTITTNTALPMIYAGGAWVRLPAGAISGGAAGLYWGVFTSTTVGSVKNIFVDPAQPFTPYIPAGPYTAAVGSGAAYSQTIAGLTLANVIIPGGSMGAYGSICVTALGSRGGVAANINRGMIFGFSDPASYAAVNTANIQWGEKKSIYNRGAGNQVCGSYSADGGNGTITPSTMAKNTLLDTNLAYVVGLLNGSDCAVLEAFRFELFPG